MRRYDLDWLRVLVFLILILYHVGMFFVPWGWHIKNNELYQWLEYPMLFVNQWRLPLLFVISGMSTSYALAKRTGKQFARERIKRLLLPLSVGIALVVPPQVYFERLAAGRFSGSYWNFWPSEAFLGIYPEGNFSWHHLWFLPYLLLFSLVLIPLFLNLRKHPDNFFLNWTRRQLKSPLGFLWFLIPLFMAQLFLKPYFPETHALIGDWFTLANYLLLFFYGFVFISIRDVFWKTVHENRRKFLFSGIIFFLIWLWLISFSPEDAAFWKSAARIINCFSWILALFGYAAEYLNRNSQFLAYANQAVYPFYILHQTITVSLGYYVKDLDWSLGTKFFFLASGTFIVSFLLYEFLIRRLNFLRPLFGLKSLPKKEEIKAVVISR